MDDGTYVAGARERAAIGEDEHVPHKWLLGGLLLLQALIHRGREHHATGGVFNGSLTKARNRRRVEMFIQVLIKTWHDRLNVDAIEIPEWLVGEFGDEQGAIVIFTAAVSAKVDDQSLRSLVMQCLKCVTHPLAVFIAKEIVQANLRNLRI